MAVAFDDKPAREEVTTQERPYSLRTPSGQTLSLVTSIVDNAKGIVSVRIMRDAKGAPFNVKGEELDRVEVPLGGSARTTRLDENFTMTLVRIGLRTARAAL